MLKWLIILIALGVATVLKAQQSGCTDSLAINFNAAAVINDGSCEYANTSLPLTTIAVLPSSLNEISGQVMDNGLLWGINDSGNSPTLYGVDTATGAIVRRIHIANYPNVDWEALTADNYYLYIGDVGNNNGTRTNLRILKVAKTDLYKNPQSSHDTLQIVEVIPFRYGRQTSFASSNNHNWDCEAMTFFNDTLHLFSKNRGTLFTYHYKLPAYPDTLQTHILYPADSFMVGMQVTDAAISHHGVLTLLGYSTASLPTLSLWMFYDFHHSHFFKGNKRKLDLATALSYGQVEGICFTNHTRGFISNERISQGPITVSANIRRFNLANLLTYRFRKATPLPIIKPPYAGMTHSYGKPYFHYLEGAFHNASINHFDYTLWRITYQPPSGTSTVTETFAQPQIEGPFPPYEGPKPVTLTLVTGNHLGSDSASIHIKYTVSSSSPYLNSEWPVVRFFPNPVENHLHLDNHDFKEATFQILCSKGSVVYSGALNSQTSYFELQHLKPGLYTLVIHTENRYQSIRFIKR